MTSTLLWLAWVFAFGVLEFLGCKSPTDGVYTLTNRIRVLLRVPGVRIVTRAGIAVGATWLVWHLLGVDPYVHPGVF